MLSIRQNLATAHLLRGWFTCYIAIPTSLMLNLIYSALQWLITHFPLYASVFPTLNCAYQTTWTDHQDATRLAYMFVWVSEKMWRWVNGCPSRFCKAFGMWLDGHVKGAQLVQQGTEGCGIVPIPARPLQPLPPFQLQSNQNLWFRFQPNPNLEILIWSAYWGLVEQKMNLCQTTCMSYNIWHHTQHYVRHLGLWKYSTYFILVLNDGPLSFVLVSNSNFCIYSNILEGMRN